MLKCCDDSLIIFKIIKYSDDIDQQFDIRPGKDNTLTRHCTLTPRQTHRHASNSQHKCVIALIPCLNSERVRFIDN